MSYILDALRKSELQRQQGATPITRLTLATETAPDRPTISLNGVIATVLVCTGVLIGWLRPWQSEPVAPAPRPAAAAPGAPVQASAASVQPAMPIPELPSAKPDPVGAAASMALPAPPVQASNTPPQVTAEPPLADPVPLPATLAQSELPDAIRREIPEMTISLHGYSASAKDSIVMINGTLLHEGEAIAPGFRLEQITPDGVIIGYKGYRFRRALRQ
ncbi:MAG: general secretion pathway protein GspB [Gallionellaceae bacterium]|nr:general secretion pathway protein GspB [Gallionellaceae bacterium]MDD5364012.1 general secretion pathway protein GspB [Gallionellaceae bacterium]